MAAYPLEAPYGGWSSQITPELITNSAPQRDCPFLYKGQLYWQETRPEQNGRTTLIALDPSGTEKEVLPYPLSTRSKINEYGGKSWVIADDTLYFVLQEDQRIYQLSLDARETSAQPITPENAPFRFGDLIADPNNLRLICVMEDHSREFTQPENVLVAIETNAPNAIHVLARGEDFYAYPRLNPESNELCWISWNHPNMPWDGTRLFKATINADNHLIEQQHIAGGQDESIFQPHWSPSGELYYVSDKSGWWNIFQHNHAGENKAITKLEAEFGLPLWWLGMSSYGFIDNTTIAAAMIKNGDCQLVLVDCQSGKTDSLTTSYTDFSALHCDEGKAVLVAKSTITTGDIVELEPCSRTLRCRKNASPDTPVDYISAPTPITFPTPDGDAAHGFYYAPKNPRFRGPANSAPPLVVMCHGGPTGATTSALNYKVQFWSSRGFAVVDVNYRGSTGYGRAYREKLKSQWGISDVIDVVAAARHLINQGKADPMRTLIRGSSAGGYTVLAALTFSRQFRAGASLYGIGNLETLATDTHKFESRYLDGLVGPYPEARDRYIERSPIHHTDQLNCPIIFFQGLEDKVVPPSQAEEMVSALKNKGLPVSHVTFQNEGHGFRKAANIQKAIEAELYFYRKILGISSAEKTPAIAIANYR